MNAVLDKGVDKAVQDAFARAKSLDLSPIRLKLMDKSHGAGWSLEQTDSAQLLYLCFLALQAVYADTEHCVVPPVIVDEFWHQHILDTRKYAEDCQLMFGYFLHHFPYFGMRGPEDERALYKAGAWTLAEMERRFGEQLGGFLEPGSCSSCGRCSSCRR